MMKSLSIIIALMLLIPPVASPENNIAVKALIAEGGARAVAMGDAFAAVAGEPFSAAYNPAGPFGIKRVTVNLGYNTFWENTRLETGYISFQKRGVVVTTGIKYWAVDNLEWREGLTEGFVPGRAYDLSAKASAAFELDEKTVLGLGLGIIYEKIREYYGSAFNFDVGFHYRISSRFMLGASVINFGSTISLREEAFDLPTSYRGGLSYDHDHLTLAADVVQIDNDIHAQLGGEYRLFDVLSVRAGYRSGYDSYDFSAGIGFRKRNFRIDYAFLPYKENLNDSHIFNLTFEL
jgi:hypothetical protein